MLLLAGNHKIRGRQQGFHLEELIVLAFSHDDFLFKISLVTAAMPAENQWRIARLTDKVNPEFRSRVRNWQIERVSQDSLKRISRRERQR